jgi:diguanylate cyclase (GGDEF)-like protein
MPPVKKLVKILVVDDEIEFARLIQQRFRKQIQAQEFDFIFALDGLDALQKLKANSQIGMVLTDINMPHMDGFTLLNKIAEMDETLRTVVISAYGDLPNIRKAMNLGAFDFLTKPIDFQDLEITIRKTLRFVQQIREKQQQMQKTQAALLQVTFHDALTGLPNRLWFMGQLAQVLGKSDQGFAKNYAVLFIDLDRFQLVNDGFGHAIGDILLQDVAQRLRACLRDSDIIARLGGDEFAILLPDIQDDHAAMAVANLVQEQLRKPFTLEGLEIFSAASIGIALGIQNYQRPEELLRDANVAMYSAKARGKGGYEVFDPIMQIQVRESLLLENDLRWALEREELGLYYQPIIATTTGKICSFEVLIRWQHPTEGWISPGKFIPLAEESRLIIPIGWRIFKIACAQLRAWQQQLPSHTNLKININLSAIQLQQVQFAEQLQEILEITGLAGQSLKLEITESYLLEDTVAQIALLQRLKKLGIQICIDDFGTGYSSLSRLHEFPIDTLKIDRSFIQRIDPQSGKNLETIRMIITLAHSLGMDVVAEGIESEAQLQTLQQLGCDFIQGFLIASPMNSSAARNFLEQPRGAQINA